MKKIYQKHHSLEPNSQPNTTDAVGFGLIWQAVLKRKIMLLSFVVIVITLPILYLVFKYQSKVEAAWWPGEGTSWLQRKQLTLTNNSGATLNSTAVAAITVNTKALYDSGYLQSGCGDLRIVYQPSSSQATELTRYVSYPLGTTCSTSTATKINFALQASIVNSANNTNYYLYYSNPDATAPSNTDNAFDIGAKDALLVCPFDGSTTCAAGETPSTESGAIRYSGAKSAMSFDGQTNGNADSVTGGVSLSANQPFTVEYWIYPRKFTSNDGVIRPFLFSSGNYMNLSNAGVLQSGLGCGTQPVNLTANTWAHISVVYTGTTIALFKDGVSSGSFSCTSTSAYSDYQIGSQINYYGLDGLIDEVRISDVARYSSNFTPSTSPFVRDSNTKLLLHFDENGDDPRNTGKAIDDSGNGNHGTITGAKYVAGLVGVDASTSDTGNVPRQSYAGHEGIFIEEATTNKITNPSFDHATYNTNWATGANITATENTTAPYYKFGTKSAKLVDTTTAGTFTTSINVGNTNTHTFSAYVYNGTSGAVGGTVDATVAKLVYNGTAQTTTYTDMGGGWWRLIYSAAGIASAQNFGVQVLSGKTVYVDGVQLELFYQWASSTYATSYFDGSFGTGYAWTGTANNSTSTRTATSLRYSGTGNISRSSGSISFWYKLEQSALSKDYFGTIGLQDTAGFPYIIGITFSSCQWGIAFRDGSDTAQSILGGCGSQSGKQGKWQHAVFIWQSGSQALYLNSGSIVTSSYTTGSSFTGSPLITVGNSYGTNSFKELNGMISDLRIYSSAFTATEVSDLYRAGLLAHSQGIVVDRFDTGETKGQNPIATWHMDEGYGATANDSSIYRNNLTVTNALWDAASRTQPTKRIAFLKFDGAGDYLSQSFDSDFDFGAASFSISGWFRHPSTVSGTDTILARYGTAGYKVYMNSSGYVCFGIDDDSTWTPDDSACSTTSYADSKWHHFEAVKSGTTSITLYIDGNQIAQDATIAATGSLNTVSTLYLGIDSDGSSNPWDGFLDDVIIYPYARSASQVKADLAGGQIGTVIGSSTSDPLTQGLVGYWKMDEASWNGTAGEVIDASGNGNNGTAGSTGAAKPTTVSGKYANAGGFGDTGVDDYVTKTDSSSLSITGQGITLSAWINPDDNTGVDIIHKESHFTMALNDQCLTYADSITWSYATIGCYGSITTGSWQHVTVTFDGNTIYFYKNGEQIGSKARSGSLTDNSNALYIGAYNTSQWFFDGKIDEVRVYSRALSSKEVRDLYNFAPGPVGHWNMDEKTGQSANDISGNSNTGTLGASSSVASDDPTWTAGKFGSALSFDGSNDYVSRGAGPSIVNTVEFWTYPTSTTNYFVDLNGSAYISASAGTISATGFTSPTIYVNGVVSSTLAANTWQHVAVTTATNLNASALNFGKISTNYLAGKLDDVRIYNYARNSKQIVEDMNAGHPAVGSPVGSAVGHWKFDEGYGATANNSGNGASLNGTITGATWTNSGKFGKGLTFAGSTNSVSVGSIANVGTVSFWVNPSTNSQSLLALTAGAYISASSGTITATGFTSPIIYVNGNRSTTLTASVWQHVLVTTDTGITASALTIGRANSVSLTGSIDEVKIYNFALTSDEVKTEYNRGSAIVMGKISTDSDGSTPSDASAREYCIPGDTTSCSAPVGEWKMDEGTGGSVNDTSGNANTGTWNGTGATHWSTGKIGKAGKFNGSDDYVSVGTNLGLSGDFSGTISTWVKRTSGTDFQSVVVAGSAVTMQSFSIGINGNGEGSFSAEFNGGNGRKSAAGLIPLNTWTFLTVVKTPGPIESTTKLYLNGVEVAQVAGQTGTPNFVANLGYIGTWTNLAYYFNGQIDQVRIYNYARTPAQIAWDYNRGGPVGWWKMDECQGGTANDASGNSNNGTITIGATGSQTAVGTCNSGVSTQAWNNGATGKFNSSLNFDGTDDYVDVNNTQSLDTSSAVTVAAWIKPSSVSGQHFILEKRVGCNSSNYWLSTYGSKLEAGYYSGNWRYLDSLSDINTSNWQFVVAVMDGTTIKLFINGSLDNSTSMPYALISTVNETVSIGESTCSSQRRYFSGSLDDVRIYNYALTAVQIKTLLNEGAGIRFGPATGSP